MAAGQPIRGLKGQRMSGTRDRRSRVLAHYRKVAGTSGTLTAPGFSTICDVFLIGGGGGSNAGPIAGGGAGAAYKRFPCAAYAAVGNGLPHSRRQAVAGADIERIVV